MIQIELPALIKQLNPVSRHIFEKAASICVNMQNSEITVAHFLLQAIETPLSDIEQILVKAQIDLEHLKAALKQLPFDYVQHSLATPAFSPLLVALLQDAFLLSSAEFEPNNLRSGIILLALLHSPNRYLANNVVQLLSSLNKETLKAEFKRLTSQSAENSADANLASNKQNAPNANSSIMAQYMTDVTQQALDLKLDPVLARDKEIDLMIDILCRRRKNNPIIVGDAGVGKSALIEGLALRIASNKVPHQLKDTHIMNLDLGALQAGAAVKGEFEKRFKDIMAAITSSVVPIILFIDEAHTLIGAGNQSGGLDVSNLLKPLLARGELKTIAATTWREYKKIFEKDAALSRRFQLVKVDEPSVDETLVIMRGLRQTYEMAHNVIIDDEALQAAAYLSSRYLSGRMLPDKAIDVLDTACARIAINLTSPPSTVSELENRLQQYQDEIALLHRETQIGLNSDFVRIDALNKLCTATSKELEDIHNLWQEQQSLVHRLIELRGELLSLAPLLQASNKIDEQNSQSTENAANQQENSSNKEDKTSRQTKEELLQELEQVSNKLRLLQQENLLVAAHVDKKQIAAVIAGWTGVPINQISQNELEVITHLPQYLQQKIKGQDLAIAAIHRHLLTSRADLRKLGRPLGAFLLVGPSGVGKTESVIQIAHLLFGGTQYLTTINMSEYQEKHTLSRLIGSPPGYVGYGEGGILTEAIRQKPYSVVLLDEVEKAHPDVLNLFYQAFDKGELADGEGRVIDCKNVVFFLTSNLGYKTIVDNASCFDELNDKLYPNLAEFFKPALLARMEIVPYLPLSQEVLSAIVQDKLQTIAANMQHKFGARVEFDADVGLEIISRATRSENGARMLESIIDGHLLPPASLQIMEKLAVGKTVDFVHFGIHNKQFVASINAKNSANNANTAN